MTERDKRLEVQICTAAADRMRRIRPLPRVDGVCYLVSCQGEPVEIPAFLRRDDVRVIFSSSIGLSNNRNHALAQACAPYVLIADDDLVFFPAGLAKIIEIMDRHADVAVATFRSVHPCKRVYPASEHDLSMPCKGYSPVSFEIALRVDAINACALRFSPLMGIGAPYLEAAEENLLLLNAVRLGLCGRFFPVDIAGHHGPTTSVHSATAPGMLRAQGAYIVLRYGVSALPRIFLKAKRSGGCPLANCHFIFQGAWYAIRHRAALLARKKE